MYNSTVLDPNTGSKLRFQTCESGYIGLREIDVGMAVISERAQMGTLKSTQTPTTRQEAEPCARLADIWGTVKCSRWVKVRDQLYFAGWGVVATTVMNELLRALQLCVSSDNRYRETPDGVLLAIIIRPIVPGELRRLIAVG